MRTTGETQTKVHSAKTAGGGGGTAHAPRQMTSRSGPPKTAAHGPQMGARNAQMGAKRPPTAGGGNRPAPKAQPQGKKKPGER